MPALAFAAAAAIAPNPATTNHNVGGNVGYICHMAALHWAFMDLGDTNADANHRLSAINRAVCRGCTHAAPLHGTILAAWYGANLCGGAVGIDRRDDLYAAVAVGDVVILPRADAPMHSMVVVRKTTTLGRHFVYVRGFNNYGTLGTGLFNQYDDSDRDIDRARYWHSVRGPLGAVALQRFGQSVVTGGRLLRVPYANFSAAAVVVRNNIAGAGNAMVYGGPV